MKTVNPAPLAQMRVAKGISQAQTAEAIGVSLRHYQKIESGETPIGRVAFESAIALSNLFGITLDQLAEMANKKFEGELTMKYTEIKASGKLLYSYDKQSQGQYNGVYGGTVEWWAVGNEIYRMETNENSIAYTGRSANTEYLGTAKNVAQLEADLNAETMEVFGETVPTNGEYYDDIYSAVKRGQY